jgi:chemotaxis signal transduction protein
MTTGEDRMAVETDDIVEAPAGTLRERAAARRGLVSLLLFRAGGERWAVDLASTDEALDFDGVAVHRLPAHAPGQLGIAALRGTLHPLYSVAALLGLPTGHGTTALVVPAPGCPIALLVDDVDDVLHADLAELRDPPAGAEADVVLGVLAHEGSLVGVLDLAALVASIGTPRAGVPVVAHSLEIA